MSFVTMRRRAYFGNANVPTILATEKSPVERRNMAEAARTENEPIGLWPASCGALPKERPLHRRGQDSLEEIQSKSSANPSQLPFSLKQGNLQGIARNLRWPAPCRRPQCRANAGLRRFRQQFPYKFEQGSCR